MTQYQVRFKHRRPIDSDCWDWVTLVVTSDDLPAVLRSIELSGYRIVEMARVA